jgi:hypothetical protein
VADVLARDCLPNMVAPFSGPTRGPFSGPTSGWGSPAAGHLTGVYGGRRTGPGLPVKCGGPFSGPTPGPSDLRGSTVADVLARDCLANRGGPGLGRKLRAGCLVKSAVRQLAGPGQLTKHGGPVLA